jgi:hypothetical protein
MLVELPPLQPTYKQLNVMKDLQGGNRSKIKNVKCNTCKCNTCKCNTCKWVFFCFFYQYLLKERKHKKKILLPFLFLHKNYSKNKSKSS